MCSLQGSYAWVDCDVGQSHEEQASLRESRTPRERCARAGDVEDRSGVLKFHQAPIDVRRKSDDVQQAAIDRLLSYTIEAFQEDTKSDAQSEWPPER